MRLPATGPTSAGCMSPTPQVGARVGARARAGNLNTVSVAWVAGRTSGFHWERPTVTEPHHRSRKLILHR